MSDVTNEASEQVLEIVEAEIDKSVDAVIVNAAEQVERATQIATDIAQAALMSEMTKNLESRFEENNTWRALHEAQMSERLVALETSLTEVKAELSALALAMASSASIPEKKDLEEMPPNPMAEPAQQNSQKSVEENPDRPAREKQKRRHWM